MNRVVLDQLVVEVHTSGQKIIEFDWIQTISSTLFVSRWSNNFLAHCIAAIEVCAKLQCGRAKVSKGRVHMIWVVEIPIFINIYLFTYHYHYYHYHYTYYRVHQRSRSDAEPKLNRWQRVGHLLCLWAHLLSGVLITQRCERLSNRFHAFHEIGLPSVCLAFSVAAIKTKTSKPNTKRQARSFIPFLFIYASTNMNVSIFVMLQRLLLDGLRDYILPDCPLTPNNYHPGGRFEGALVLEYTELL
jgi:hypothetical protein